MKIKPFAWLTLLLILVFPLAAKAQEAPLRVERISTDQGLSQVTVYAIFQDRAGFMWFGTEDGLNRYDGYTFKVYKRDPKDPRSLSANTVRAIFEDSAGRLWVGTDGGLNLFDRSTGQFTHFRHDPDDPSSLSNDTVTVIFEDASGELWVGTEGGLNRFNPGSGAFTRYQNDPADPQSLSHDSVSAILEDSDGKLWVATLGGGLNLLAKADRSLGAFTHLRHLPQQANSPASDEVTSIIFSRASELWIGTLGGLDVLDLQTGQYTHYVNDPTEPRSLVADWVSKVFEDSSGMMWVGTNAGLELFDRQARRFTHYRYDPSDLHSPSPGDVISIAEDASGVLWFGTNIGGLNKLDLKMSRFTHYRQNPDDPDSLGSNAVWGVYEDSSGGVWVAASRTSETNGGLYRLDRASDGFTHYGPESKNPDSLSAPSALVVYQDSSGDLWVGTYGGGLNKMEAADLARQDVRFTHYRHDPDGPASLGSDIVWAILEDTAGMLWFGVFEAGLDRYDPQTGAFTHYTHDPGDPTSLSSNLVLALYQDRAGTMWVGTTQGLDQFNPQAGSFKHYRNDPANPASLASNAVPVIFEDSSGAFWIGTDDGLDLFDREKETFTHYSEVDGLANDAVAGILEDQNGYLWISSSKGLSRFNPRSGEFKNYDVRDGLQSDEFNRGAYAKGRDGRMYFGGVNGVTAFYPADITDNPQAPSVVLTDFRIFNKPVAPGERSPLQQPIEETQALTLSYWDYVFSFEFAALDYSISQKNRYAYMLEGFDEEWIETDSARRFASYANIPSGKYTFRVKGANNDGVWNEDGAALQLTITPPPWLTWWAYLLYALALFGIAAAVYRYRTRELQRKHLEQTMWAVQAERDRIAALLESRRQLVASISHDLRSPVAAVRSHLELALEDGEGFQPPPRRELEIMLQELDRLRTLLDDLFTLSRLDVDHLPLSLGRVDASGVARRAVSTLAGPAWQRGRVQVITEPVDAPEWVTADERRLMQALMNLLHNAIRHTPPGGMVAVRFNHNDDAVAIQVVDTGEGIQPDDLPRIWERFYRGQSQAGGGTGIGLALVKELTEAMGGSVAVESALGEGSCFTITLPRPGLS